MDTNPVALVTGAAKRIGAQICRTLHQAGFNIIVHYHRSQSEAEQLTAQLNQARADSAISYSLDLLQTEQLPSLIAAATQQWGRLDALINNASTFYATPIGSMTEQNWQDLFGSNVKAPLFLSQAAAPELKKQQGNIINMVDIHAENPLPDHSIYAAAKAGLVSATKSFAKELAPDVRVNAIAPGPILWPDKLSEQAKQAIIADTLLQRRGEPEEIAKAIKFLLLEATYTTGQVLKVDGGRGIN